MPLSLITGLVVFMLRGTETKGDFRFLTGLNVDLDGVRGRILGTRPLPSLRLFSLKSKMMSRWKLMVETPPELSSKGSALAHKRPPHTNTPQIRSFCNNCKKSGYTIKDIRPKTDLCFTESS